MVKIQTFGWTLAYNTPLRNQIFGPLPLNEIHQNVSSIITHTSTSFNWDLSRLPFQLHHELIDQISSIALPVLQLKQEDGHLWNLSKNGEFTLKSAYNFITLNNTQPFDTGWIWKTL